jgi:hypothetical protein
MESEYQKSPLKSADVQTNTRSADEVVVDEKYGTLHDGLDMDRMGKLQQLRVRWCKFHHFNIALT